MNTFSHITIGNTVRDAMYKETGILLPVSFVWACCKPDFTLDMIRYPHHFSEEKTLRHVQEEIRTLCRPGILHEISWHEFSVRLGMVCHYLCDFFCFVHNDSFDGSFKEHFLYEWHLDAYFRDRRHILKGIDYHYGAPDINDVDQMLEHIERSHGQYLDLHPSWGIDLICSVQICTELSRMVLQRAAETCRLPKRRRIPRRLASSISQ